MPGRLTKFSFIVLLFFLTLVSHAEPLFQYKTFELKGRSYRLEIANTFETRRQGLMHRPSLAERDGMLFIYPTSGDYRIWMKNTLIPLSVIWLDEQARIIEIKNLQPCGSADCPVFSAGRSTRYILELNASQGSMFKVGDVLSALRQHQQEK